MLQLDKRKSEKQKQQLESEAQESIGEEEAEIEIVPDELENEGEGGPHLNEDDWEHLSQFDPDDEFLQSERSFSIIDSLVSSNRSMGVKSLQSRSSDFSIVSKAKSAFSKATRHS